MDKRIVSVIEIVHLPLALDDPNVSLMNVIPSQSAMPPFARHGTQLYSCFLSSFQSFNKKYIKRLLVNKEALRNMDNTKIVRMYRRLQLQDAQDLVQVREIQQEFYPDLLKIIGNIMNRF